MPLRRRIVLRSGLAAAIAAAALVAAFQRELFETRVRVVVPGRLIRGAWQGPGPLGRIIEREHVRTVVTLTAINRDDPKYVSQSEVVRRAGVDWVIVPMRGSTATLDQLAEAADLLADPARQPVFFHCVGGHHRTGLAQAAYRIRHEGWSAERAWRELAALPWTRPDRDTRDRELIEAFARAQADRGPTRSTPTDESDPPDTPDARPAGRRDAPRPGRSDRAPGGLPTRVG
jgi:hypothetical protein